MARRNYRGKGKDKFIQLEGGLWVKNSEYRKMQSMIKDVNRHNAKMRKLLRNENYAIGGYETASKFYGKTLSKFNAQYIQLQPKKVREDLRTKEEWDVYYNSMVQSDMTERFAKFENTFRDAIDTVFGSYSKYAKDIHDALDRFEGENRKYEIEVLFRTDEAFTLDYVYDDSEFSSAETKYRDIMAGIERRLNKING